MENNSNKDFPSLKKDERIVIDMGEATYSSYVPPFDDAIPICAHGTALSISPSADYFKTIEECGFNIVERYTSAEQVAKDIATMASTNLFVSLANDRFHFPSECLAFADKIKNMPRILIMDLGDEPNYDEIFDWFGAYNKLVAAKTGKLPLFNLCEKSLLKGDGTPEENKKEEENNPLFERLKTVNDECHPILWSFDQYPFYTNVDIDKDTLEQSQDKEISYKLSDVNTHASFYKNYEALRKIVEISGNPFWAYVQCMPYLSKSVSNDPSKSDVETHYNLFHPVTEATIRFSVFTALAYGAQGIRYWSYACREESKNSYYTDAPVTLVGNKTKLWDYVKTVNEEIKKFSDVFFRSLLMNICHIGKTAQDDDTIHITSSDSLSIFSNFGYSKNGALLSIFEKNTYGYLVIVSHSIAETETVTFEFWSDYTMTALTSNVGFTHVNTFESPTGTTPPTPVNPPVPPQPQKYKIQGAADIAGGGYAIIRWKLS